MITHASLFSGIGGAEIAAAWRGWDNLFHCDISEFGLRTLRYWFPNSTEYNDIKKTDFTPWRGRVDVLTGGFPCQPFSSAGKRRGADDDRYLWPQMLRAIREVQPRYVVGENVAGLLTMVEQSEAAPMGGLPDIFGEGRDYFRRKGRFTLDRVCGDIEGCGYAVQAVVIPALAVGAPHRRDRVWVLAKRLAADPDGERQEPRAAQRVQEAAGRHSEVGERDDGLADGVRRPRAASDPDRLRQQGRGNEDKPPRDARQQTRELHARPVPPDPGFEKFPTQPPLCGGDDGLSVGLADSPVFGSRRRWASEALKALGNAWCPQVAYEIFGAIEEDIMKAEE